MNRFLFPVLLVAFFLSCNNRYDLDCVEDYKGMVVVDYHYDGKYTLSNGCDYKNVEFPSLYSFSLGDTIGRLKYTDRVAKLEKRYNKQLDSLNKVRERYKYKLREIGDYTTLELEYFKEHYERS